MQYYSPEPSPVSHLYASSELPTISALKQIPQVQYNLMGFKSVFLFMDLKCWQVSTSLLLMSSSYFELRMVEPSYYSICGRFVFNCWASAVEEVCSPFKQLSKEWADGVKYNSTKKKSNKKPFLVFFFLISHSWFEKDTTISPVKLNKFTLCLYYSLKILNKPFVTHSNLFWAAFL